MKMRKLSDMEVGVYFPVHGSEISDYHSADYWRVGLKVGHGLWIYIHDEPIFRDIAEAEKRCEKLNRKKETKKVYKVQLSRLIKPYNKGYSAFMLEYVTAKDVGQVIDIMDVWTEQEGWKDLEIFAIWYSHEVKE